MAALDANVFATHTQVTLGLLRNGPAVDVARTARESSIDPKYFFTGIRWRNALIGDLATHNPPCPVAVLLQAQICSAFVAITDEAVRKADAAHIAAAAPGAGVFDPVAARATAAGDANNRADAIAIGSVHASLVQSFQIVEADLNATEVGPAIFEVTPPVAYTGAGLCATAMRTIDAGWTVTLVSANVTGATTVSETIGLNMAAMSAVEVEISFACMSMGQASPVRAGAQLFEDGHHYHSDAEGSARHKAIEREVTSRLGPEARTVWKANVMRFRNAIWHAGPHVVSGDVLQGFAEDNNMPARLDATGYGSMSVGLPAQEDLFRRAGSYTAVYNQTNQTAIAHGHTISIATLTATVTALSALPRRGALAPVRPALPGLPGAAWPAGCDTRAKALKLYLEPALDAAEPVAAWLFGFYKEICSRAGIRASSQEGSLLRSYSLKRAVANYLGESNRAQEMYTGYARYIRTQAEGGHMETYTGNA